ncbi:GNAT family N-acetyltransferase [Thalassobaculum sp. OXR-137]|uniref:GNAT family N-acetyltransferase n=1 Tax=Thalassobaculum sp. OXR-137 TaxID=3100173 RepID=UPI002AC9C5EF|nr:GNAT family N-acetyltransferase [Thalassobaculum sp. OXR-137]WPZ36152.1 GNAT family N-acetyltransferase [Thalassobaculum sp. OXR-137]
MPDGTDIQTDLAEEVSVLPAISAVAAEEWDACAGAANPFLSHDFLNALEESGSVRAQTGWLPRHLAVNDANGRLAAAMPLYLKGHSQGEYVFDWGWADAYERAGGRYYPKLLSAVPFTPVTGPRMLIRPDIDRGRAQEILAGGIVALMNQLNVTTAHVNFVPQGEWDRLGEFGFLQRKGLQYHWHNNGYASFDDFLDALSSRKRKAIRKERRQVAESDLVIRRLVGKDIEERHWDAFFAFYMDTSDRKWGSPYLNRTFFSLLGERMAERVLLVVAERDGRPVAGALNLIGSDTLYGRNWGCTEEYKFLHFEACYYQAIDFAIERGMAKVEAGAQGQHKIQRGYLPVETYSNHLILDDGFRDAVEDFLARERRQISHEKELLLEESPFRKDD